MVFYIHVFKIRCNICECYNAVLVAGLPLCIILMVVFTSSLTYGRDFSNSTEQTLSLAPYLTKKTGIVL